jgi:undecaprenyl-diphosphatase
VQIQYEMLLNTEFIFDAVKLAFYVICGYIAFGMYARSAQTPWLLALSRRRFTVLVLLILLVVGIKVFEDVITKESAVVDAALLWFIRENMSVTFSDFLKAATFSGSGNFLAPFTVGISVVFFLTQHRRESVILLASMACAWSSTYALKALVGRVRPELWSTEWYWGSSFPSGHTLSTASFATALALAAAHIWPRSSFVVLVLAATWIGLVGLSRLVLGVHWPTDVLAAICLGIFIPLAIRIVLGLFPHRSTKS